MGVAMTWRSQGIGHQLLAALVLAARKASLPALSLSVETDNYAMRLYESFGFRAVVQPGASATMRLAL